MERMKEHLPFDRNLFTKVAAVVMTLVLLGFGASYLYFGELTRTDIIGTLISASIGTYMIHLWMMPPEDDV